MLTQTSPINKKEGKISDKMIKEMYEQLGISSRVYDFGHKNFAITIVLIQLYQNLK